VVISVAPVGDIAMEQGPGGLAFGADGRLIIGIRKGGPVIRMTLASGVESGRTNFGSFGGWVNGLALDRSGRVYAGLYDLTVNTSVMRIASDGLTSAPVAGGGRSRAWPLVAVPSIAAISTLPTWAGRWCESARTRPG
jgi:hypothetical protein